MGVASAAVAMLRNLPTTCTSSRPKSRVSAANSMSYAGRRRPPRADAVISRCCAITPCGVWYRNGWESEL